MMANDGNPWDKNEGLFDRPSSSAPSPDPKPGPAPDDEPREKFRGVEPVEAQADDVDDDAIHDGGVEDPENHGGPTDKLAEAGPVDATNLRRFIERVMVVEEQLRDLRADLSEIYAEAKGQGYQPPIMRKIVAALKLDPNIMRDNEAIYRVYQAAMGMTGGFVLGDAMLERAAGELAAKQAAAAPKPAKAKKPTTKDLALAEAVGWAGSDARH